MIDISNTHGALGVINTHSGTCAGLLFLADEKNHQYGECRKELEKLGEVFETRTLKYLL